MRRSWKSGRITKRMKKGAGGSHTGHPNTFRSKQAKRHWLNRTPRFDFDRIYCSLYTAIATNEWKIAQDTASNMQQTKQAEKNINSKKRKILIV